jgi:hypothetical protein
MTVLRDNVRSLAQPCGQTLLPRLTIHWLLFVDQQLYVNRLRLDRMAGTRQGGNECHGNRRSKSA